MLYVSMSARILRFRVILDELSIDLRTLICVQPLAAARASIGCGDVKFWEPESSARGDANNWCSKSAVGGKDLAHEFCGRGRRSRTEHHANSSEEFF